MLRGEPVGVVYPLRCGRSLYGDAFDERLPAQAVYGNAIGPADLARLRARDVTSLAARYTPLVAVNGLAREPRRPYQRRGRRLHDGRFRKRVR